MAIRPVPASDSLEHLMTAVDAELYSMTSEELTALRKRIFGAKEGDAFSAESLLAILRSHLLVQVALRMDVRNR